MSVERGPTTSGTYVLFDTHWRCSCYTHGQTTADSRKDRNSIVVHIAYLASSPLLSIIIVVTVEEALKLLLKHVGVYYNTFNSNSN